PATSGQLSGPLGVTLDADGNLYVADSNNSAVRQLQPDRSAITPSPLAPLLSLESPQDGANILASPTTTISGWALDSAPSPAGTSISSVDVLVDGVKIGSARYGISRPDVCAAYPGRP